MPESKLERVRRFYSTATAWAMPGGSRDDKPHLVKLHADLEQEFDEAIEEVRAAPIHLGNDDVKVVHLSHAELVDVILAVASDYVRPGSIAEDRVDYWARVLAWKIRDGEMDK